MFIHNTLFTQHLQWFLLCIYYDKWPAQSVLHNFRETARFTRLCFSLDECDIRRDVSDNIYLAWPPTIRHNKVSEKLNLMAACSPVIHYFLLNSIIYFKLILFILSTLVELTAIALRLKYHYIIFDDKNWNK